MTHLSDVKIELPRLVSAETYMNKRGIVCLVWSDVVHVRAAAPVRSARFGPMR